MDSCFYLSRQVCQRYWWLWVRVSPLLVALHPNVLYLQAHLVLSQRWGLIWQRPWFSGSSFLVPCSWCSALQTKLSGASPPREPHSGAVTFIWSPEWVPGDSDAHDRLRTAGVGKPLGAFTHTMGTHSFSTWLWTLVLHTLRYQSGACALNPWALDKTTVCISGWNKPGVSEDPALTP